ncbi:hypothetical protein CR513_35273, partial [Mucuna pruriens]
MRLSNPLPQSSILKATNKRRPPIGLRKRLEEVKGRWVEELPQVLWSYHTALHSATQETLFHLTFGMDAMIQVEVEESSQREKREMAHIRECVAKAKVVRRYNAIMFPRPIRKDDLVLRRTLMGAATRVASAQDKIIIWISVK